MKLADQGTPRRFGVAALVWGALVASAALALAGCSAAGKDTLALAGENTSSTQMSSSLAGSYQVLTLNDRRDLTFNQLLGVNDEGLIAGYFGSGAAGHPNKGYLLNPRPGAYLNENFPGSVQTQVTGLNNEGVTVGFWSSMNNANQVNDNHGFVEFAGRFRTADFPAGSPAAPPVDQLLGVNDR